MSEWTFITNHARVLIVIAQDQNVRLRDIARAIDITERAAQRIVSELVEAGYLTRRRKGRRNVYTLHPRQSLRAPGARSVKAGEFLDLMLSGGR